MLSSNSIKTYYHFLKDRLTKENRSEFLWFAIGYSASFVLGFVILKILAQLGTEEYGKYALIITIVNLIGLTIFSPALQAFNRYYFEYSETDFFQTFLETINSFVTLSISVSLFVVIAVSYLTGIFYVRGIEMFLVFSGIYIIFIKLSEFASGLLNIKRKRKQNSFLIIIEKTVSVAVLFILLWTNTLELYYVLIFLSLILVIISIVKLKVFGNYKPDFSDFLVLKKKSPQRKEIYKNLVAFSFPFILWGVAFWVQTNGERWVIANYLTTSDVGIFSVMMSIANAAIAVPTYFLNDFFVPIIYGKFNDPNDLKLLKSGHQFINLNTWGTILLTFFSVIATYFYGKEIIILISSGEYILYSTHLPVLCLGVGLFYIGHSMSILGLALKKPNKYLVPKVATGIISLLLYIFLIQFMGMSGIIISVLIIGIIYLISIAVINTKLT